MPTFLTVKEAAQQTRRSPSSIRRIIYPIIANDEHPDRSHVEPTVEQVKELRIKGENFAWRISQELLDREAPPMPTSDSREAEQSSTPGGETSLRELVIVLREELRQSHEQMSVKDQQIASLSEITKSLNERLREGNILMGSLQKQLVPGDAQSGSRGVADAHATPKPAQDSRTPAAKPAVKNRPPREPAKTKRKASYFQRLFR